MIKDNQKVFNRLLVIMDALITAISFVLAYYIKFYILNDGPGIGVLPVQEYYKLPPIIVPGYMLLYYRCIPRSEPSAADMRFTAFCRQIPSAWRH